MSDFAGLYFNFSLVGRNPFYRCQFSQNLFPMSRERIREINDQKAEQNY
jgi:hypothetical protein